MSNPIVDLIKTYPLGGGYIWDKDKPSTGVTHALIYQGATILKADVATYCCGIQFELWFETYGKNLSISVKEMRTIQKQFYCALDANRRGAVDALVPRGLAVLVNLEQAQEGDLFQIWRMNGSGHSVVYRKHDIKTLTYFSTQKATNGLGDHTEFRSKITEAYGCRPMLPAVAVDQCKY